MKTGKGQILEIYLDGGMWIVCPPELIPAPGQYLLASNASDSVLPASLFYTDSALEGFIASPLMPHSWMPGMQIALRGPVGRGFSVPVSARKVALVAFDAAPWRLRGLIRQALKQGAAVVVVSDFPVGELSDDVEVQPSAALHEVLAWADYAAFDVARENLFALREKLGMMKQVSSAVEAQVLIRTAMPCGGGADCAVCAVSLKSGWQLACKDGPVFDLREV